MDDIFTYIFYTLFFVLCIFFSSYLKVKKNGMGSIPEIDFNNLGIYLFMLIYSLIVGLRYNVGKDFTGYNDWFKVLRHTGRFPVDNDFGFIWLNELLVEFEFESYSLFIIIAYLQILFLLLILKKLPFLRSWYIYFFFTSLLFFVSMNTMRQTLAYFIFIYCLQLYYEKRFLKTFLFFLLAFSMHKTIILPIVMLPFLKFEWFKNIMIQLMLLFLSLFILPSFYSGFIGNIEPFSNLLGYTYYTDNLDLMKEITEENKRGDGLSIFLFFLIDLLIILHYDKLKDRFNSYNFIQFYNLFFLGVILSRVFADNFILSRIADYFIYFRVIILSFLMFYIFNIAKDSRNQVIKPFTVAICLGMFLFFYKAIYNNAAEIAPIQFFFNHD